MSDFNHKFFLAELKEDLEWTLEHKIGDEPCEICPLSREQCIRARIKETEEQLNEPHISN